MVRTNFRILKCKFSVWTTCSVYKLSDVLRKNKLDQSMGRCQVKLKQIGIIDYSSGEIVKKIF